MNQWNEIKKIAICEADDFCDRGDRNGLDYLIYWKSKYPNFKITLFTIPGRTSPEFLKLINPFKDWIELAVHGWEHESNYECWHWDEIDTEIVLDKALNTNEYVSFFKAPGWCITPKYNGYPADEDLPVSKDPQCVYKGLMKKGFVVVDRHYNKPARPEGLKVICADCQPDLVHMHTWRMETGNRNERNGFDQVEHLHGVPWDNSTEFKFLSEAWAEGLIKECQS